MVLVVAPMGDAVVLETVVGGDDFCLSAETKN
jgi:hypothetical protein